MPRCGLPRVFPGAVVCPHGLSSCAKYRIAPPLHVAMPISISDKPCYVNLILAPQHTNENPRVQKYPPVSAM
jgi:hypothetical protein